MPEKFGYPIDVPLVTPRRRLDDEPVQDILALQEKIMRLLLWFLAALPFASSLHEYAVAARVPNIVLIVSDDQGYRDLGSFGSDAVKTPRLDASLQLLCPIQFAEFAVEGAQWKMTRLAC